MVAAGLAASTPHMISATITALSRLMFEFQGETCILHSVEYARLISGPAI